MLDVLIFQLQLLAQHQEPDAYHKPHVHHIQSKLDVFKELMGFASGQPLQVLLQVILLLHQHRFAD